MTPIGAALWIHFAQFDANLAHVRSLADRVGAQLDVVTKVYAGHAQMIRHLAAVGVESVADSHLENISTVREMLPLVKAHLTRSLSEEQIRHAINVGVSSFPVVNHATARKVSEALSESGARAELVVPLVTVDQREGLSVEQANRLLKEISDLPSVDIGGVAATFGCRTDAGLRANDIQREVAELVGEFRSSDSSSRVTVGGSSILHCAPEVLRRLNVSRIRIGEAIALGTDGLGGGLAGLSSSTFVVDAPVIQVDESRQGNSPETRLVVALGSQDIDFGSLRPLDLALRPIFATSDHLVLAANVNSGDRYAGKRISFAPGYASLLRCFISPYVTKLPCDCEGSSGHH